MQITDLAQIFIGALMIVLSLLAIHAKEVMRAVIYLSFISMLAVVGFVIMQAPDVAITEAVIGSGLSTALFVFALFAVGKAGASQ